MEEEVMMPDKEEMDYQPKRRLGLYVEAILAHP